MTNYYVSSVGYDAVAQWAASTAYSLGQYVRQLAAPSLNNERVWKCTTAGTSGGTEPSWNLTINTTTADNTVVWTEVTGKESEQTGGNWAAPAARIGSITLRSLTAPANGDFIFVSQDHAETQSSAWNVLSSLGRNYNGLSFVCVARDGGSSVPPVTADLRTTATVTTTGNSAMSFGSTSVGNQAGQYWYGISFIAGSGASGTASILLAGSNSDFSALFENCLLHLASTAANSISFGVHDGLTAEDSVHLKNTSVKFGNVASTITLDSGYFLWEGSTAIAAGGSTPNILFTIGTAITTKAVCRGVDLTGIGALANNVGNWGFARVNLENCRLAVGETFFSGISNASPMNRGTLGSWRVDNCDDSTGNTNYRFVWYAGGGNAKSNASVKRDGGAALSWQVATVSGSTAPTAAAPMRLPTMTAARYNTTGSPVTATVYCIANAAAALTTAQIWLEIEALTVSGSPLSSLADDSAGNVLPSTTAAAAAQTADTSDWSTGLTARANSTAYALGDVVSVPGSAAGTAWFCTVAGTSSGSLPGGYSGATDGATVADGSATFRAGQRQKLAVTFTPAKAGTVLGGIRVAGSAVSVFIDPTLDLA